MNRAIMVMSKIFLTVAGVLLSMYIGTALADEEVIDLVPVAVSKPDPIPCPFKVEVTDHALDQREVETLAEFLWKSPMYYETQKRTLLWVVFNRVDDTSGRFADDIESVCRDRREWGFMSAHRYALSDDNLRIVREEMNRWLSMKDGKYIGHHVPRNGVFCSFGGDRNRIVTVYAELGGEALEW